MASLWREQYQVVLSSFLSYTEEMEHFCISKMSWIVTIVIQWLCILVTVLSTVVAPLQGCTSMIGLGQEDESEEITLQPEICWHDVIYHKADHCMNWPHSANVGIFWSRPGRVLSFFEHLVHNNQHEIGQYIPVITLKGKQIEQVKEFNALGLTLDENMTWSGHVQK